MTVLSTGTKGHVSILYFDGTGGFHNIRHFEVSGEETVDSAHIGTIYWSANNNATWEVSRGGNTLLKLVGSGSFHFESDGIRLETDAQATANVSVALVGNLPKGGTILLKMHKKSSFTTEY
jgi:hypothetical protein